MILLALLRSICQEQVLTHGLGHSADLTTNTSISENTDSHSNRVTDAVRTILRAPLMLLLRIVKLIVLVSVNEVGHDHPLGDLRAMDTGCSGDRDVGVSVDRVTRKLVGPGRKDLDKIE